MDFSLSEERKMLQETVSKFFESNYKNINKRGENVNLPEGYSKEFWENSSDLGVISALVSSNFGGLVMAFEEEFGSEISDSEAEKILTVGDAIKFIESKSS